MIKEDAEEDREDKENEEDDKDELKADYHSIKELIFTYTLI